MAIRVLNIRIDDCSAAEYIGRGGKGTQSSPLANPRRIGDPKPGGGVWERGETVELYERDLRQALDRTVSEAYWWDSKRVAMRLLTASERQTMRAEMNRLYRLACEGDLCLACFCAPAACHGDAIVRLLEEAMARG